MRYIAIDNAASTYRIFIEDTDIPECADHDVLIQIAYAGVNRADLYQAEGSYGKDSERLGLEVSGTIVKMGKEVRSHAVGDKVCALLQGGGYAEYVAVAEWRALPIPKGVQLKEAAALMEASCTAYRTVAELGELSPGEVFLVHGGTSAIGMMAIQLAKTLGATVITTAGSAEKCKLCEELGADLAIPYKEEAFEQVIETHYGEVDLILDMVGGNYIKKHLKLLRYGGRIVQIAFLEGAKVEVNLGRLLMKNISWQGFTLRSQPEELIYQLAQSVRSILWPCIEAGDIRLVVDSVYPLENAQEAHERMRHFKHAGKIVLKVGGDEA